MNLGDIGAVKKVQSAVQGDPSNFRHTKGYIKSWGGTVVAGMFIIVGVGTVLSPILDFFWPNKTRHNNHNDNNNRKPQQRR